MDARLQRILGLARSHVPGLRLVDKRRVWWLRLLGRLLRPLVPEFRGYTTVLGRRVYLPRAPEDMDDRALAATLAHELVHQLDQRRWGPLFYLSYGFALPLGRTMRAYWERRAYAVDLLLAFERGGDRELVAITDQIVDLFAGRAYLWMWPGHQSARTYLAPTVDAVRSGRLARQEPYRTILAAWRGEAPDTED